MTKKQKSWRDEYVLARVDPSKPYGPGNVRWRLARTEREARWGVEECPETIASEPDAIPLTAEEKSQREKLPVDQRVMFDVWCRIRWRAAATDGRN